MPTTKRKPVDKKDKEKKTISKSDEPSTSKTNGMLEISNKLPLKDIPINVVKQFDFVQRNGFKGSFIHRSIESIVSQRLYNFKVFKIVNDFDRRVTCVSWHPSSRYFIVGTKSGAMHMMNYTQDGDTFQEKFIWAGGGPGLSILSIHYLKHIMPNTFLSAGIDGTVKLWNLQEPSQNPIKTLMSTGTIQKWFCSVNSCYENNTILVGDSKGNLIIVDKNLKVVSSDKIHKNKVNTIEFSKTGGWTFVTASTDSTVKIFDLRKIKKEIEILSHEKGVTSAYFSKTNSGRLLTTDHDCELRIYKGPMWELERTIRHPHRQFMHISPISATWHPCTDLIVVGRYPDNNKSDLKHMTLRTIDIYSADTGLLKNELYTSDLNGIICLNEFSPSGEYLASGMGNYLPLWRYTEPSLKHKLPRDENGNGDDDNDSDDDGPPKNKKPKKNDFKTGKTAKGKTKT